MECGGPAATVRMKRLSFSRGRGRRVTLTTDSTQDRTDRYGRLLAHVRTDARRDLAIEQLRAGWATVYVFERPFQRHAAFQAAEQSAREAGRGVWSACGGNFHQPASG